MEDVKIMENMKEVLKKARRSKHKKSREPKDKSKVDPEEDAISDILNRNWVFSSPPNNNIFKQENGTPSPKVNAFERMMSKKSEPLSQISPELNGTKKKKSAKKPKHNRLDSDNGNHSDSSTVDENKEASKSGKSKFVDSPTTMLKFLKGSVTDAAGNQEKDEAIEESGKRKRLRTVETPTQVNGSHKKRKTKVERLLLDSNENPIQAEPPAASQEHHGDTPTYQSGRPRRSCAGNVNYEMLISPDKAGKLPEGDDPTPKRPKRTKQSAKANDADEIWALDDDSPIKDTKPVKLAPLFMKKLPKPSIDPVVKEARRNFLLSGLPENLRTAIDKQKQYEDEILSNELIAFPSISHVTQQQSTLKGSEVPVLWENSVVKINADDVDECEHNRPSRILRKGSLTGSSDDADMPVICEEIRSIERTSIKHGKVKELVKRLKERFEDFPTNRCFKQLFRQYKNATRESDSDYYSFSDNASIEENLLFVDIFKPNQFEEFFINTKPVKDLKEFLLNWNDKSEEYDSDESGSRQSSREMNNFAVLTGVSGVGKTSSVYALAKDLNYQVIEINAGSRRSGKKMLQDLFEATQSHRVKNKSGKKCSAPDDSENSQGMSYDDAPAAKSIILVEDAELVFESDEGFVSSIQQLINISKRPVLLTTNNRSCQHLQKYIQNNEIMFERPRNANHIAKYLSLLCLAANYQINESALEHLFALNEHDLRKTINEIEFFIRSANTRSNDGDLMALYGRPRRERSTRGELSDGVDKSLSALSFDTSIASSCAAMFVERADVDETSYHHRHLMDEMAEFFASRCNVAETQRDLAHGKQKIIER